MSITIFNINTIIKQLNDYPNGRGGLDTTHTNCMGLFKQQVQSLFAPGSQFSGATADQVATTASGYLKAGGDTSNYLNYGMSQKKADSCTASSVFAADLQNVLDELHRAWLPEINLVKFPFTTTGLLNDWSTKMDGIAATPDPKLPPAPSSPPPPNFRSSTTKQRIRKAVGDDK